MMRAAILALAMAAPAAHAALRTVEPLHWSRPGAEPYTGTVADALAAMGLPADVRDRLEARIALAQADGWAWFTPHGIVSDAGDVFAPHFDMTTGNAIAPGSTVGFREGAQAARMYRDGEFVVLIPTICRNATRAYPPGWPGPLPAGPGMPPAIPAPGPDALLPPGGWWPGAPIPPVLHGEPGYPWAPDTPALGWPLLLPGVPPAGFGPGGPAYLDGPASAPWPAPAVPVDAPAPLLLIAAGVALAAWRRA